MVVTGQEKMLGNESYLTKYVGRYSAGKVYKVFSIRIVVMQITVVIEWFVNAMVGSVSNGYLAFDESGPPLLLVGG